MKINEKGFTIVEVGIVMIIITLLAGGVFGGIHLIRAGKIRGAISQIETYQSMYKVFGDQFNALPGDFSQASTYIKSTTPNGNGDGKIEWETTNVDFTRQAVGTKQIMWSSDYPHTDSPWPRSREFIAGAFENIPEDDVAKIVGGNAAELYGIS